MTEPNGAFEGLVDELLRTHDEAVFFRHKELRAEKQAVEDTARQSLLDAYAEVVAERDAARRSFDIQADLFGEKLDRLEATSVVWLDEETGVWVVKMGDILSQGTTPEEALAAGHSAVNLTVESMAERMKQAFDELAAAHQLRRDEVASLIDKHNKAVEDRDQFKIAFGGTRDMSARLFDVRQELSAAKAEIERLNAEADKRNAQIFDLHAEVERQQKAIKRAGFNLL